MGPVKRFMALVALRRGERRVLVVFFERDLVAVFVKRRFLVSLLFAERFFFFDDFCFGVEDFFAALLFAVLLLDTFFLATFFLVTFF